MTKYQTRSDYGADMEYQHFSPADSGHMKGNPMLKRLFNFSNQNDNRSKMQKSEVPHRKE